MISEDKKKEIDEALILLDENAHSLTDWEWNFYKFVDKQVRFNEMYQFSEKQLKTLFDLVEKYGG